MSFEDDRNFLHVNGKEYTVRIRKDFDHDSDEVCECCGLTTKNGSHGIMIKIVEMYDENYVDISKKSSVYRAAKKRYDADGKWHFMCDIHWESNAHLYDDGDVEDFDIDEYTM